MPTSVEACENCGRTIGKLETGHIHNDHIVCGNCIAVIRASEAPSAVATAPPAAKVQRSGTPTCQQCGGEMKKAVVSSGNCLGIALALIVFTIGVMLCFTGIGAIIGVPLCIVALFIGGKRQKVWKCRSCKSVVNRA